MKLRGENITKSFGTNVVLDGLNLNLNQGQIVGLLGRNGAGKSTLLKIIAGINLPDEGMVSRDDLKVGYLSERNPLYPQMYVREYLSWISDLQKIGQKTERISWVIERVGLEEALGKKIIHLSKGFRQRVGLAATLLSDPHIIILDEPISGLDPIQIKAYRNLIQSISAQKIIILSSHIMQEIEALCDRVLLLKDGQIIADRVLNNDAQKDSVQLLLSTTKPLSLEIFTEVPGVLRITSTAPNIYHLAIEDRVEVQEAIFDIVVEQKAKILEMKKLESSLSQLFDM